MKSDFLLLLCWISGTVLSLPQVVRIGGIFPEELKSTPVEVAFKYAVYSVNRERKLLANNTTLVYRTLYYSNNDIFQATKIGCQLISGGISALFASGLDVSLESHLKSLAFSLDLPLFLPTSSFYDQDPPGGAGPGGPVSQHDFQFNGFPVKLAPSRPILAMALRDAVLFLNWTRVALLYDESEGLSQVEFLIKKLDTTQKGGLSSKRSELFSQEVTPKSYRDVLNEIKRRKIFSIIADIRHLPLFFRIVLQLQMNDARYHYHFTTLDLEMYDLEDFAYNSVNITSFRLIEHSDQNLKAIEDMQRFNAKSYSKVLQTDAALMYDGVLSFCHGLKSFDASHEIRPANVSCEREQSWPDGLSLLNYINSVSFDGLTGKAQLREGNRHDPTLTFLKLKNRSLQPVGEWSLSKRLTVHDFDAFSNRDTINVTLRVTTVLEKPYVMLKPDTNLTGNARYEGFCIDLLKDVAHLVGFQYTISIVKDGKYGVEDPDSKQWNGIVRELLDGKSDLAVGSMTINSAREKVIDFTKPFRNLGISILFKLPKKPPARLFSFLNPLSAEIWAWVAGAYVLVCFCLFVVARFTPNEWLAPPPCAGDEGILENQFSFPNSVWFITGTFLRQGSGLNPKATSTRLVGGIWWFFTLIIVSSYTANLAAFLTVDRKSTPIESASDLAHQTDISYGTLDSGSTMDFFRNSTITTYKTMWTYMESHSNVFVQTYEQGITRVLQGNYAFLIESPMLDYAVQRDCNLTQIGSTLDSKGYGIGMPKGSPWRDKLSLAILELQEKGMIQLMYNKWWKNTGDVCNRDDKKDSKASPLGIDNIGGVFVVLFAGLILAVVVAICEFCCHVRRNAKLKKAPLCSEMKGELTLALRCCHSSRDESAADEAMHHHSKTSPSSTYVPVMPESIGSGSQHLVTQHHREQQQPQQQPPIPMFEMRKSSFEFDS
ncbi:glutamate receptor ionotropic, kainate 2 isoform X2 [Folsomia candida]|uniref:glutamate receptor ionotropic, kainate 2 isoform X2 n=1 Tax=Folsomia candida TaxID=158441 RepID=UPI001604F4EC|nr:glutamate receptor ionotropic, kainate 2 isoform X2 [Folsomia candida]